MYEHSRGHITFQAIHLAEYTKQQARYAKKTSIEVMYPHYFFTQVGRLDRNGKGRHHTCGWAKRDDDYYATLVRYQPDDAEFNKLHNDVYAMRVWSKMGPQERSLVKKFMKQIRPAVPEYLGVIVKPSELSPTNDPDY